MAHASGLWVLPCLHVQIPRRHQGAAVLPLALALGLLLSVSAHADETLVMSRDALKIMAESAVVKLTAIAGPAGPLHKREKDCEFHFVIEPVDPKWRGEPAAWVAEPPNVCLYNRKGQTRLSFSKLKTHWGEWAEGLKDERITAEGVPRIWFEHTSGGTSPANPDHVFEIHPATKITVGSRSIDFTKWIHDIPGFSGISDGTIEKILAKSGVEVEPRGTNQVEVTFDRPSRIGNFGRMVIRLDLGAIKDVHGGSRTAGKVRVLGNDYDATFLSVTGTNVDKRILDLKAKARGTKRTATLEVLGLFSLDPAAIWETLAAGRKEVKRPIQVILFGLDEDYGESGAEDED